MRRYLTSAKPIGRAERVLGLMMLSAVYTGIAVSPVGARLSSTVPMLRDANPVHYVSAFHNPFAESVPTGHYDVPVSR